MKTLFLLLFSITVYAQSPVKINIEFRTDYMWYDKPVSLGAPNIPLSSVLSKIEDAFEYDIAYLPEDVYQYMIVFPYKLRTLKETLDLALKNTGLTYTKLNNSIIIHKIREI